MNLTTNEILKATKTTPILLKRTLDALPPEVREAFVAGFSAEISKLKALSERNLCDWVDTRRPDNARECENLLKRTMRLP